VREAIGRSPLAVPHNAVYLPDIVRHIPWAVIFGAIDRREERAVADSGRTGSNAPTISEATESHFCKVLWQLADVVDLDCTGGGEVTYVGVVRSLADIHRPDQFGDEKIDVSITLPVAVSGHVDGHSVDRNGKISAVIEIEAAQEILVGFAFAGVLGDDQAGHDF
jgi:hypothetical protein